ncbi:MDR family oxidoreductase [Thermoactinomyces mirandus]|uniref:Oxidoreductase n=1 Tax=Thermoactinomyces mirandus TaxID=2756294 RepID=A0A7W2ASN7_9BACL|nr:MDR family oxidoreductase [Thermoactinomyces mirandus]MBA4603622.1 oxidoreductase [Thermoactinomyces mirandus]
MRDNAKFEALVVDREQDNVFYSFKKLSLQDLPAEDVLIRVHYSSLNYKDGMAVLNRGKIVRKYPMIPGIDLVGTVEKSKSPAYQPGDPVILTGWETGETHWGGYAEYASAKAEWLVPLSNALSMKHAMSIGTAGLTAMLAIMALKKHGINREKPILVTGASGGVGSLAVAILSRLGYQVDASTGSESAHSFLRSLGATEIIDRRELAEKPRPLQSQRWGGAVDVVGGNTLSNTLAGVSYYGTVASCGLAGDNKLNATVYPFILRGIKLVGIDSNTCPPEVRKEAWNRLAEVLSAELLDELTEVHGLKDVPALSEKILRGEVHGRIVIDIQQ